MSKADFKFRRRVYEAHFRRNNGDETLGDIALEYGLNKQSIYNHARKHIKENLPSGEIKTQNKINRFKAGLENKLAEVLDTTDNPSEAGLDPHEQALNEIIALGAEELKAGRLKLNTSQFLGAIKIKADIKNKSKDRQAELVKTMYKFASGEKNKVDRKVIDGTPTIPAGNTYTGEKQPGDIYKQVSGDAPPFWPETVSADTIDRSV